MSKEQQSNDGGPVSTASMISFVQAECRRTEAKISFIMSQIVDHMATIGVINKDAMIEFIDGQLQKSFELTGEVAMNEYNLD